MKIALYLLSVSLFSSFAAHAGICRDLLVHGPWDSIRNQRLMDLLIKTGIDFKSGDKIIVRGDFYQKAFMKDLAQELRKRGAENVDLLFYPNHEMTQKAIEAGMTPEEFAQSLISSDQVQKWVREGYSSIRVLGSNETGTPAGFDPAHFCKYGSAFCEALDPYVNFMAADNVPWTLVELPTQTQASRAIPELSPRKALKTFKEMVAGVFWLNHDNPSERWIENATRLEERGRRLSQLRLKKLHYQAKGTDFTVELHERAQWRGGRHFLQNGRQTIANFPGFENFVSPKCSTTEGRVQVQRPVTVMGTLVKGAWFEFKAGQVVEYGADEGKDALTRYFEQDPRNRYLGEVALVDDDSPVLAQKRLFYSIVFDENALSHIALGAGYPHTFALPHPVNEADFTVLDMNSDQTKGHTDFMIGTSEMLITAETHSGKKVVVVENGKIVLREE